MVNIQIILGSNRPTRFVTQPAAWLLRQGKHIKGARFASIDLAEIDLPFLNEPEPALHGFYQHEHTKQWSRTIEQADGFVFVTPEYNHGYSAVLKNAIDFLYHEWSHKPVAFLSYGSAAGGARAVEQLRAVAGHLSMYDITEHVIMPHYYQQLDATGSYQFDERQTEAAAKMLRAVVFWAKVMKSARQRLKHSASE